MADTKITSLLTPQVTTNPATDVLPIVNIADTSMASSGSTRKITVNTLLGAGGTATLASATITGAATVGTTLGVTGVSTFAAGTAALPALTTTGDTNTGIYYPAADTFAVTTGGTERYRVDSAGNVGIGVTPSAWNNTYNAIDIGANGSIAGRTGASNTVDITSNAFRNSGGDWIYKIATSSPAIRYQVDGSSGSHIWLNALSGTAGNTIGWSTLMTLNAIGLGIGVTSSLWNNTYNVLDIGQNGSISGRTSTNNTVDIVSNGFRNSGGNWEYKLATSSAAGRYQIDGGSGSHLWYNGVAGTAGNAIAGFSTPIMTLDGNGNLILLSSNTPATLTTNGQLTVNATSDTNLRFSYRGSDGTTRVANITLA